MSRPLQNALNRTPAQAGVQGGTRNRRCCLALAPRLRGGTIVHSPETATHRAIA